MSDNGNHTSYRSDSHSLSLKHPYQQQRIYNKSDDIKNNSISNEGYGGGSYSVDDDDSNSIPSSFNSYSSSSDDDSSTSSSSSMTSTSSSGLDKETIFAAAMIANRQMMNRKPILLGSNSDGTMNVQLPSGTVIVVEAEATDFPGYTTKTKTFKKNKRTKKSSQGKYNQHSGRLRDNLSFSSKGDETVGKSSATTSNSAVIHSKPNQPTTSNATVEQIERALPNAASCVFHVFDRRVNLEAYNADTVTNYALLRAWVQDDPYRYLGPIAEDLVLPTTTTTMRSTTTVLDQTAATRTDSGIKEVSVSHETVANVDILSELRMGRDDASLSVDTLRKSWVQQARGVKRRTLRDIRIRDAQILRSLNARGVKLN